MYMCVHNCMCLYVCVFTRECVDLHKSDYVMFLFIRNQPWYVLLVRYKHHVGEPERDVQ